jgi:hypothetical protein
MCVAVMPTEPIYDRLIRVNVTIEGELHAAATNRAKKLGLEDGFSGLVSRLLIQDQKRKSNSVAKLPRRFHPKNGR